jgi:Cu2+-exporting ATPase
MGHGGNHGSMSLTARPDDVAERGRTAVLVAVDGRGAGVIALAGAVRTTSAAGVAALHDAGVEVVMLSGDREATGPRSGRTGRRHRCGHGGGHRVADVVLMRSDPLHVPIALTIGHGTLRTMRQDLGWAVGYNALALPIAAGVFEPAFGVVLRPEIAALAM